MTLKALQILSSMIFLAFLTGAQFHLLSTHDRCGKVAGNCY